MKRILPLALVALSAWTSASAQTLELRTQGRQIGPVTAGVGDTVRIGVWVRLDCLEVSGIDLHLSLPADAFRLVDGASLTAGLQPFADGGFLDPAVVAYNGSNDVPDGVEDGRLHVRYSALTSMGAARGRRGHGLVATLHVIPTRAVDGAQVRIEDTPIRETRLVLPDGKSERRFVTLEGIEVSASTPATEHPRTAATGNSWGQVKRGRLR